MRGRVESRPIASRMIGSLAIDSRYAVKRDGTWLRLAATVNAGSRDVQLIAIDARAGGMIDKGGTTRQARRGDCAVERPAVGNCAVYLG